MVNDSPLASERIELACASRSGNTVLLAEFGSRCIGYIVLERVLDEVSILAVGVDAAYRRLGYAAELLDAALAAAVSDGAVRCLLEVRESNLPAIRLYENRGFSVDGVRGDYYLTSAGREDALLMSKEL